MAPSLPSWFPQSKDLNKSEKQDDIQTRIQARLESSPMHLLILGTTPVALILAYRRWFRRIPNSNWVTPNYFNNKKWIKGYVTSVGDADNFRLYHAPGFGWSWPLKFRRIPSTTKELKDKTIHIRIAGADAPEAAHFGRPSQPYCEEALAWLKSTVANKKVYCQLIRRDQYGRIVSHVIKPRLLLPGMLFSGKVISLEMIKAGWATTYEQAGAEYGKWGKDAFLMLEKEAKAARRGIWKDGTDGETPGAYKKRYAQLASEFTAAEKDSRPKPKRSWWRGLFS